MARALEAGVFHHAGSVEVVVRRLLGRLMLAALAAPAAAQLPQADSAFDRGDYRRARVLYASVLIQDSLNPRALYRLAIFDSWDGKLQQSLARFTVLRRVEPRDPDIMVAHAKVLAWAGRTGASEALYDSVLVRSPRRADALAGRARAVAWSGDLVRAERLWREAQERHPDNPEILTGLAQTLYWEGKATEAESYVARARDLAPGDRSARDVVEQLRAARRPTLSVTTDRADDVEHNRFVLMSGALSGTLRPALRGTVRASWRRNDLGSLSGVSEGFDGSLVRAWPGGLSVRAGAGVRALDPGSGASRTFGTVQLGIGMRPAASASLSLTYTRSPFDETALLVQNGFVWDELALEVEAAPRTNLDLSAVANGAWLSDHNRRLISALAVMVGVAKGLHVGAYGRLLGYREANPGRGYFAPDRFSVAEARAAYSWRRPGWSLRAAAGVGAQQVGSGAATQAEWHGDVTAARSWRTIDELALVGFYTNSATARSGAAITTGSYRYWSIGLRYRMGL